MSRSGLMLVAMSFAAVSISLAGVATATEVKKSEGTTAAVKRADVKPVDARAVEVKKAGTHIDSKPEAKSDRSVK